MKNTKQDILELQFKVDSLCESARLTTQFAVTVNNELKEIKSKLNEVIRGVNKLTTRIIEIEKQTNPEPEEYIN